MGLFSHKKNNKNIPGRPEYVTFAYSLQGKRDSQEDSHLIMQDSQGRILGLVADGVGGYPHGEFASATVTDLFRNTFVQMSEFGSVDSYVRKTLFVAATMIMQKGMMQSDYREAATTVSGFIVDVRTDVWTFNVGDSRVYLIREGEIKRLTKDHSLVQDLLDKGEITPEQAFSHPQKNILTNMLRSSITNLRIDVDNPGFMLPGDILLATTDGIHDYLTDNSILNIIINVLEEENPVRILAEAAQEAGGTDNATAVMCRRII